MNFSKIGKYAFAGLLLIGVNQSCTDLETEIYSEIETDDFFQSEEEIISALGAAYTSLYGYMGDPFAVQEVTTDEVVVPTRGNDWDDGGNWRRLHLHTYVPNDPFMNGAWNFNFGGVNTCNRLLFQFEQLGVIGANSGPEGASAEAELTALRAFFYAQLLDMFGNVPIVDNFDVPAGFAPENNSSAEVFAFVEESLLSSMDNLDKTVGGSAYARMNFYTAQAVLANLYMNAEKYTGQARYDDALTALNEIMDSGRFALAGNFFDNFKTDNAASPEIIFAIPYDQIFATGFNINARTLHYGSQQTYDFTFQPWNGYCSLEEFYNGYDDSDVRKDQFIQGQQFTLGGEEVLDSGAEAGDFNGPPLFFQAEINELGPNALRQAGVRIGKYEFAIGATENLSNDFLFYRYADIMLLKAEALMRTGGDMGEAMDLVNAIRNRAGLDSMDDMDMDDLYEERRREMAFEGKARTDMIRFDKYNEEWWAKNNPAVDSEFAQPARLDEEVRLFPIPEPQLNANANLRQNDGY